GRDAPQGGPVGPEPRHTRAQPADPAPPPPARLLRARAAAQGCRRDPGSPHIPRPRRQCGTRVLPARLQAGRTIGSCPRNSSDVRRHRPWRRSIGASAGMQPSRFGNGRQWEWNGRTLHIGTGIDPLVKFIRTLWNPTLFSTCIAKGDDLKTAAMHRPQLQAAAPQLGLIASIRRPGGVESDDAYSSRRARTPRTTLAIVPSSRPSGGMRPRAARRPPFARDDTGLPVRSRFRVVRAGATPVEHQRRGMPMNGPTRQTPSRALRRAALPAALLLALAALPAAAQQPQPCPTADDPDATCAPDTTPATELDRVEVRGLRASMIDALQIKQGSMQIVDAIVAEDIGKFPDNNLVEALQRVTGVQTTD